MDVCFPGGVTGVTRKQIYDWALCPRCAETPPHTPCTCYAPATRLYIDHALSTCLLGVSAMHMQSACRAPTCLPYTFAICHVAPLLFTSWASAILLWWGGGSHPKNLIEAGRVSHGGGGGVGMGWEEGL